MLKHVTHTQNKLAYTFFAAVLLAFFFAFPGDTPTALEEGGGAWRGTTPPAVAPESVLTGVLFATFICALQREDTSGSNQHAPLYTTMQVAVERNILISEFSKLQHRIRHLRTNR
jgi:hypothetical protein